MRVERLEPGRQVAWTCLGDHDEWKDTRLEWAISPEGDGSLLHFVHGNWRKPTGFFALCNTTWGELLHRLRAYAESGRSDPRWAE